MIISMNNVSNVKKTTTQILFEQLDLMTCHLPIKQLLSEIQIVIERLSFSEINVRYKNDQTAQKNEVDILFEGEVSDAMLDFVHWLIEKNGLGVLSDRVGRLFLEYCIKAYKDAPEVKLITAVELDDEFAKKLINKIRILYPAPTRIVYYIAPNLVAGIVIKDGSKTIDLSLNSFMVKAVKPRIAGTINVRVQ